MLCALTNAGRMSDEMLHVCKFTELVAAAKKCLIMGIMVCTGFINLLYWDGRRKNSALFPIVGCDGRSRLHSCPYHHNPLLGTTYLCNNKRGSDKKYDTRNNIICTKTLHCTIKSYRRT